MLFVLNVIKLSLKSLKVTQRTENFSVSHSHPGVTVTHSCGVGSYSQLVTHTHTHGTQVKH